MIFSSTWLESNAEFAELQQNISNVMKKQNYNTNFVVPEGHNIIIQYFSFEYVKMVAKSQGNYMYIHVCMYVHPVCTKKGS